VYEKQARRLQESVNGAPLANRPKAAHFWVDLGDYVSQNQRSQPLPDLDKTIYTQAELNALKAVDPHAVRTYAEFWPYYLSQHSKRATRVLHLIGTSLGVAVACSLALAKSWLAIPAGIICGYGFAWYAHFFIEKNKPATFVHPWWSFISDFKMLARVATGRLRIVDVGPSEPVTHNAMTTDKKQN
jgi:hypothetical protein